MTEDEAIGLVLGKLSRPANVRSSKATHIGDASDEWTVLLEMFDGSQLFYVVQSDRTVRLNRILAELLPSPFDRGSGGRFLLELVLRAGTFLVLIFFVIRLLLKLYRG